MRKPLTWIVISLFLGGCGVKGRPQPPLERIQPGDGTLRSQKEEQKRKSLPVIPRPSMPIDPEEP